MKYSLGVVRSINNLYLNTINLSYSFVDYLQKL